MAMAVGYGHAVLRDLAALAPQVAQHSGGCREVVDDVVKWLRWCGNTLAKHPRWA